MSFTYRPRAIDKIVNSINKVVQVVGYSGSGKTYAIQEACKQLGYRIVTLDEEYRDIPVLDLDGNYVVLHLDHPSYWYDGDIKRLQERGYVVIEDDKPAYPVSTVWMDVPPISFFTKLGVNTRNWWKVHLGGEEFSIDTQKDRVVSSMNKGSFTTTNDDKYLIFDTAIRNYYGIQLLYFLQLFPQALYFQDHTVLNGLRLLRQITEPNTDLVFKLKRGRE